MTKEEIVNNFHNLYYEEKDATWCNTTWMGTLIQKNPFDLWIYQEIIHEIKPDLIIETGTLFGGSALYFANLLDVIGKGEVITIDTLPTRVLCSMHPRITYLQGSSLDLRIVDYVRSVVAGKKKVLVNLDSDHSANHVLKELQLYSPFVTVGSYVIVEDSNINGNPVLNTFGLGPKEAIESFLEGTSSFISDREQEKFLLTFNPKGYLKRVC